MDTNFVESVDRQKIICQCQHIKKAETELSISLVDHLQLETSEGLGKYIQMFKFLLHNFY